jgi:hypothetical protein
MSALTVREPSDAVTAVHETAHEAVHDAVHDAAPHETALGALRSGPAATVIRAAIEKHMKDALLVSVDAATVTNVKAVLRAGLAAAAAAHGLNLGIDGSKKLALIQSLVKDSIKALDAPEDAKCALALAVDTVLPNAIDGLLFSLKGLAGSTDALQAVAPAAVSACLPLLCGALRAAAAVPASKGPAPSSK